MENRIQKRCNRKNPFINKNVGDNKYSGKKSALLDYFIETSSFIGDTQFWIGDPKFSSETPDFH